MQTEIIYKVEFKDRAELLSFREFVYDTGIKNEIQIDDLYPENAGSLNEPIVEAIMAVVPFVGAKAAFEFFKSLFEKYIDYENHKIEKEKLELEKQKLEIERRKFDEELALEKEKWAFEKEKWVQELLFKKTTFYTTINNDWKEIKLK